MCYLKVAVPGFSGNLWEMFFCVSGTLVPAGERCSRMEWYLVSVVSDDVVTSGCGSCWAWYLVGVVLGWSGN